MNPSDYMILVQHRDLQPTGAEAAVILASAPERATPRIFTEVARLWVSLNKAAEQYAQAAGTYFEGAPTYSEQMVTAFRERHPDYADAMNAGTTHAESGRLMKRPQTRHRSDGPDLQR